jgi:hypothetical protein
MRMRCLIYSERSNLELYQEADFRMRVLFRLAQARVRNLSLRILMEFNGTDSVSVD